MRKSLLSASAASLVGLAAALTPGVAEAAPHPHHNRGLTIAAPDPIAAGQGVLIYGRLQGPDSAGRRIELFHRINPASTFTLVGVHRTDADGYYEFVRADGVVRSNRNWFVVGPGHTHSRTIHELVSSVLTLNASATALDTGAALQLSGRVYPGHPHQPVLIQEQDSANGNVWHTIARTVVNAGSGFTADVRFRTPDSYTLRAFLPADDRNTAGQSTPVTVTVDPSQNPSFTIAGAAVLADGQTETISGVLYAGSTSTPQANQAVTLYGRQAGKPSKVLASTTTDTSGAYSFSQVPLHNMVYRVATQGSDPRSTAKLFVGVRDVVTASASAPTIALGDKVTLTGTVAPDHAGRLVNLQRQTSTGSWATVQTHYLNADSGYTFSYGFGQLGSFALRIQVPGGPVNVGGVSSTVSVTVSGEAPVSSLPPAF